MNIINDGLYNIEKNRSIYHFFDNFGNAIILQRNGNLRGAIKENIKLTKLENYIPYLKFLKLALIKII